MEPSVESVRPHPLDHRRADDSIDTLFLRRGLPRAFEPSPMPLIDLMSILEAARWAPSVSCLSKPLKQREVPSTRLLLEAVTYVGRFSALTAAGAIALDTSEGETP
jgi:hypothetical protein